MPDDPSVLGNLPRSRPGRRSDKRTGAKPAAKGKPAPKASRTATTKRAASKPRAQARPAAAARQSPQSSDPLSGAVRFAGQVAGAGFKVAGEVLKRFPGRR